MKNNNNSNNKPSSNKDRLVSKDNFKQNISSNNRNIPRHDTIESKERDDKISKELYFKDQERIRIEDIEREKQFKPPQSWIDSLIPVKHFKV